MDVGEDESFLFARGQDFVQIDWNSEADKEKAADAAAGPVRGLQGWGGDELLPEGKGAIREEGGGLRGCGFRGDGFRWGGREDGG